MILFRSFCGLWQTFRTSPILVYRTCLAHGKACNCVDEPYLCLFRLSGVPFCSREHFPFFLILAWPLHGGARLWMKIPSGRIHALLETSWFGQLESNIISNHLMVLFFVSFFAGNWEEKFDDLDLSYIDDAIQKWQILFYFLSHSKFESQSITSEIRNIPWIKHLWFPHRRPRSDFFTCFMLRKYDVSVSWELLVPSVENKSPCYLSTIVVLQRWWIWWTCREGSR